MAPTLPKPAELKLSQVLTHWRQWAPTPDAPPEVIAAMTQGLSNHSVLVGNARQRWVVRIDHLDPTLLGINRELEYFALTMAANAGIAPQPSYWNTDTGVLVCEYLSSDLSPQASTAQLAVLFRSIHALPALRQRLDPVARARRYAQTAGLTELPEELIAVCSEMQSMHAPSVLCHNDLLTANRVFRAGRLYAIDWEYATMGDPLFDLAVTIEGDSMSQGGADELLTAYLQRTPTDEEFNRLGLQRRVYILLSDLWQQAMANAD